MCQNPTPPQQLIAQAAQIIERLRPCFSLNRLQFDMQVTMYLSGRENTVLRQAVGYAITSNMLNPGSCGVSQISSMLSGYFQQSKMF